MAYHEISHESLEFPFTPRHWKYNGQHTQCDKCAAAANDGQVWCNSAIIQKTTYLLTYLYNNSPVFWLDIFIWHSVNINSTYSGSIMTCSWFSRTFKNTYLSMFGLGTEKKTWKKIYPQKVYMYIENSGKSSCIVGNIGSTVLQQTGRTIPSIALFFPWVWINQYSQRPLFTKIYKWEIAKRVVQGYFHDAWLAGFIFRGTWSFVNCK